jgi:hypothetical protein
VGKCWRGNGGNVDHASASADALTGNASPSATTGAPTGQATSSPQAQPSGCDAPPNFTVHVNVEDNGTPYCMAYVKNNSPYAITCHLYGRSIGAMPGEDHLGQGWPMAAGDVCQAEMTCEKDLLLAKRWCPGGAGGLLSSLPCDQPQALQPSAQHKDFVKTFYGTMQQWLEPRE